jgi:hypothetical protein
MCDYYFINLNWQAAQCEYDVSMYLSFLGYFQLGHVFMLVVVGYAASMHMITTEFRMYVVAV